MNNSGPTNLYKYRVAALRSTISLVTSRAMAKAVAAPKVELLLASPRALYTNGDQVTGTVRVFVTAPTALKQILVSLQCLEQVVVRKTDSDTGAKTTRDEHCKHYEDRHVMKLINAAPGTAESGETVLGPGTHEFKFRLEFPANSLLPETFYFDKRSYLMWRLKARAVAADGEAYPSASVRLHFIPQRVPRKLNMATLKSVSFEDRRVSFRTAGKGLKLVTPLLGGKKDDLDVTCTLRSSPHGLLQWPYESTLDIDFVPSPGNTAVLNMLEIRLVCQDKLNLGVDSPSKSQRFSLVTLDNKYVELGKGISLNKILESVDLEKVRLPNLIVGSFGSKLIQRKLGLEISLGISSSRHDRPYFQETIRVPVQVAPVSVHALMGAQYSTKVAVKSTEIPAPGPKILPPEPQLDMNFSAKRLKRPSMLFSRNKALPAISVPSPEASEDEQQHPSGKGLKRLSRTRKCNDIELIDTKELPRAVQLDSPVSVTTTFLERDDPAPVEIQSLRSRKSERSMRSLPPQMSPPALPFSAAFF